MLFVLLVRYLCVYYLCAYTQYMQKWQASELLFKQFHKTVSHTSYHTYEELERSIELLLL